MTPSPTQSLIDACQKIPRGKIKAQLQKRKDTGKVPKATEDYLRCCTVLFLQSLLPKPENETLTTGQQTSVVTLEHIRESASRYSFIDLSQISEENASKKKRKAASKKTKQIGTTSTKTTKKEIQIAIQPLTGNMDPDFQPTMQVMEDDDDYD